MHTTEDLRLFVHIADTGNLSTAARNLGLQPATASFNLKRLERELNCRLFERSTRNMRLTPQGETYLAYCRAALSALDEGLATLHAQGDTVRGRLRISAPSDWGRNVLASWLNEFQELHPQLGMTLQCSDRFADLFRDPVDMAFRYGKLSDSLLISQHLADNRRVVVVSPRYLERHGTPKTPQDLLEHNCLLHNLDQVVSNTWRFFTGRTQVEIKVSGNLMADDGDLVRKWAVAGRGIAYKSLLDVRADLAAGRLVMLLQDLTGEDWPLHVVFPHRATISPAARRLNDWLREKLAAETANLHLRWR